MKKNVKIIRVQSSLIGRTKNFKVTEMEKDIQKVELVGVEEMVISEEPLYYKGMTFRQAMKMIIDVAKSINAKYTFVESKWN